MPSLSDHTRRDAEHAARSLIRVEVMRYVRRMDELAKGHIKEAIEQATQKGDAIDGANLGQTAATEAIRAYIGAGEPQPAIEAPSKPADAR
jgi:hypothetical protein